MTEVEANPARTRSGGRAGRAALRAADAHRQGPAFIGDVDIDSYLAKLGDKAEILSDSTAGRCRFARPSTSRLKSRKGSLRHTTKASFTAI